jgi:hypothetical protein
MSSTNCLVVTFGFFGDIIFATSLAEKLKEEGYSQVDYLIGFPQVAQLVKNNPFIDQVFTSQIPGPKPYHPCSKACYTRVIELGGLDYQITPCEQYQQQALIAHPTKEYQVYTTSEYDAVAEELIRELKQDYQKPVLAVMTNWEPKTYLFTPEQYEAGIDVPNLGYGGSHRNIQDIIDELQKDFTLYPVGVGNANQQETLGLTDDKQKSLLFEASVMKYCDAFIGTDGGLASIAAGVGTKTILTGDFNLQLYGWNGVLKKIKEPRLGPKEYFDDLHIVIDPFATDKQVLETIKTLIK